MRTVSAVTVAVALVSLSMVGLGMSGSSENLRGEAVHHVVLCWLVDPGNAGQIEKIIAATRDFSARPGVVSVAAGTSLASDRPVVDDSFDVGIVMTFESSQALAAYLDDPEHQSATREVLQPLVEKLVIYDIVER